MLGTESHLSLLLPCSSHCSALLPICFKLFSQIFLRKKWQSFSYRMWDIIELSKMRYFFFEWKFACNHFYRTDWLYFLITFLSGSMVKNLLPMQETEEMQVQSLGQEDPLKKGMATRSNILAWEIPWTEELGGLKYMGSQRVRHNWECTYTHRLFRGRFVIVG